MPVLKSAPHANAFPTSWKILSSTSGS
jgi:hypothetical protein